MSETVKSTNSENTRRYLASCFGNYCVARSDPDTSLLAYSKSDIPHLFLCSKDIETPIPTNRFQFGSGAISDSGKLVAWFEESSSDETGYWCIYQTQTGSISRADSYIGTSENIVTATDFFIAGIQTENTFQLLQLNGDDLPPLLILSIEGYFSIESVDSIGNVLLTGALLSDPLIHGSFLFDSDQILRPLNLPPGSTNLRWISQKDGSRSDEILFHNESSDRTRPYIFSISNQTTRPLLAQANNPTPGDTYAIPGLTPDEFWCLNEHEGMSSLLYFSPNDNQLRATLEPDGTLSHINPVAPGIATMIHSSAIQTPHIISSNDNEIRANHIFSNAQQSLHEHRWIADTPVFIDKPITQTNTWTIIVLHGGPAKHDRNEYDPGVQAWLAHGFTVLRVNYAGSTGYGKQWRDYTRHGCGPGITEVNQLHAIVNNLAATGEIKEGRVIIEGGSWGGYLTLLALGTHPDTYAAGIAFAPVADWKLTFEDELSTLAASDTALFGGTPWDQPERFIGRSPSDLVEQLNAPILIFAGQHDLHCPIRQIEYFVSLAKQYEKQITVQYNDIGHSDHNALRQAAMQTYAEQWCNLVRSEFY